MTHDFTKADTMSRERRRCPLCDEWYDPKGPRAKMHEHPEPQSGPARRDWLKSRMPYEKWITETYEGMVWDKNRFGTKEESDQWYEVVKKMAEPTNSVTPENRATETRQDIMCPFCEEGDFDLIGLKIHLACGHCDAYEGVKP